MTTRRETLAAATACALATLTRAVPAPCDPPPNAAARYDLRDLRLLPADAPFGGRVPVLVPRDVPEGVKLPLVVALHGLGESQDPELATKAWPKLYGLVDAAERLASPPVVPRGKRGDLPLDHAATMNRELAARPHAGVIVACPFTPNPARARDRSAHLAKYAAWIQSTVVARAREQLPALASARGTHLAGCSMGGAVAIEIVERCGGAFASLALVQSAHGAHRNGAIAGAARTGGPGGGPLAILVLTSSGDPFRERNVALAAELARAALPHDAIVLPGPHDQPWLREAGTPTMLHWLDKRPRA